MLSFAVVQLVLWFASGGPSPLRGVARAAPGANPWANVKPMQGYFDTRSSKVPVFYREAAGGGVSKPLAQLPSVPEIPAVREPMRVPPAREPEQQHSAALSVHSNHDFFCENRARGESERALVDSSSIQGFIATGGRFPILVITCDRAAQLRSTLKALLEDVRCVEASDIQVIADACESSGGDEVERVAKALGVPFHRNPRSPPPQGLVVDGAERIAGHYGYALSQAFSTLWPKAPGVIVVEDDMSFSPDFYEYFHAVAPLLSSPDTWLASAWNDNGFDYLVADLLALRRTRYFPGLGWLLPRTLWESELANKWPPTHWDHWMRDPAQHLGRDVIYPEVPRDYHMGVKGTFMDTGTHNKYFGSISMANDSSFTWDTPEGAAAIESATRPGYKERVTRALSDPACVHLSSVAEMLKLESGTGVLWYDVPLGEASHESMRALAAFVGIWHEGARGSYEGVHEIWWLGTAKLWLVNMHNPAESGFRLHVSGGIATAPDWVRALKPSNISPAKPQAFEGATRPQLPIHNFFGADFASPLSHIDGGHDGNGAPDGSGNSLPALAPAAWRSRPSAEDHQHSRFMGDLNLPPPPERAPPAPAAQLLRVLPATATVVKSSKAGLSCDAVCEASSLRCDSSLLPLINDCGTLRKHFTCAKCGDSQGSDQPALISEAAPIEKQPLSCLVNSDPKLFSCWGKWEFSQRLCTCVAK
jgi:GNT-I family/Glycosyltransferase family 18